MYNALVLAGSKGKSVLEISNKVENKALIIINNRPIIDYVIEALNEAEKIGKIVVVGPKAKLYSYIGRKVEKILEEKDSLLQNLEIGMNFIKANFIKSGEKVLIITSDIPLITSQAIDDFIEKCLEKEADIYYPIMRKENILERYPETKRTYVKTKDGELCGGNMFLISPKLFYHKKELIKEAYDNRKEVKKFAKVLGLKLILKFLFKTITVTDIEKKVSEVLGCKGVAVVTPFPETMIDLDKPSDLELIQKCLS